MKKHKKREYNSSELINILAKVYGFEDKLKAFEVKSFLENELDPSLFSELEKVELKEDILLLKIQSPLIKHDMRMKKSFFLKKIQETFGKEKIADLVIF
ncbi:MAG: hypothetical protein FDW93_02860 [Bergeyella sp.]|nr:hypothetical protein [Bergeyella sp.]